MSRPIACVSGGTGMIGSRIVEGLLSRGYKVRILSRKRLPSTANIEVFIGDIRDDDLLKGFMHDSRFFFHCAAELKDVSRMWEVNVTGTERIVKHAEESGIEYFCHLSSVGVFGKTTSKTIDETSHCDPQNAYEKSKFASEEIVSQGLNHCRIIILRPTNVIDEKNPGVLLLPERSTFLDYCKVFLKGAECGHIVHAEDVARVALFFISYPTLSLEHYIVSYDDEPLDTFAELWALHKAFKRRQPVEKLTFIPHLPLFVPYALRKAIRGKSNMGDVRYSAKKLLATGFRFELGLKGAVQQIALTRTN